MKNSRIVVIVILCLGFIITFVTRFKIINSRYPNPEIITQDESGCVMLGSYKVQLLGYKEMCIDELLNSFPDSEYFTLEANTDNNEMNIWYLISIKISNTEESNKELAIYNVTIANDNTSNGLDMFAFEEVNNGNNNLVLSLRKNESIDLVLPFTIRKEDMSESKDIRLLFSLYPEIISVKIQ